MTNNIDIKKEKHEPHKVSIIVNGRSFDVIVKEISFEELIKLAFGSIENSKDIAYTVTYSYRHGHSHDNGILVSGEKVKVKEGMVFNVTKTSRS